jgi:guanylate kinase
MRQNIAVFLFGASGCGKGYIKKYIQKSLNNYFYIPCEVTTRLPRQGDEFDRLIYSKEKFDTELKSGKIIHPIKPFGESGPVYGFIKERMERDLPILGEIDEENYNQFKAIYNNKMYIFAIRWNMDQYRANILSRGEMSKADLEARMVNARKIHNDIDKMWKKGQIYKIYNINSQYNEGINISDKDIFEAIVNDISKIAPGASLNYNLAIPTHLTFNNQNA